MNDCNRSLSFQLNSWLCYVFPRRRSRQFQNQEWCHSYTRRCTGSRRCHGMCRYWNSEARCIERRRYVLLDCCHNHTIPTNTIQDMTSIHCLARTMLNEQSTGNPHIESLRNKPRNKILKLAEKSEFHMSCIEQIHLVGKTISNTKYYFNTTMFIYVLRRFDDIRHLHQEL